MRKSSKCGRCVHREKFGLDAENFWMCNYLLDTGFPRPCEPGKNCTVFESGKKLDRRERVALPGSRRKKEDVAI